MSKHLWINNASMSINKVLLCFFSCFFFRINEQKKTNSYIYVMQRVTLKHHLLHIYSMKVGLVARLLALEFFLYIYWLLFHILPDWIVQCTHKCPAFSSTLSFELWFLSWNWRRKVLCKFKRFFLSAEATIIVIIRT